jgi:outer membrane immunogenic protein
MRTGIVRAILSSLIVVTAPAAATAQERWEGFYLGGFAGYADGNARSTAPFNDGTGFYYNVGGDPYAIEADGFAAGGLVGGNWQSGALVFGLEAELGYKDLGGTVLDPNAPPRGWDDTFTSVKSDLYGAVTVRLGFTAGNALLYVKGGAAFLDARGATIDDCIGPPAGCGTQTLTMTGGKTMAGWVIGGGLQWALDGRWDIRAEYAYFDFGRLPVGGDSTDGLFYTQIIGIDAHTFKAGVGYRF